ncbi:MAG: hypothetical protein HW401_880 [Parcubacteria group bacterium]|nr:hypothetical protein [Parcubacteria group bacterium]
MNQDKNEKFDAILVNGGKRGINWFKSTSPYGYNIATCISTVVKEIRHGNEKSAIFWGHQVAISGIQAEKFLWEILRVHSIEDCGVANPSAICVVTDVMQLYFDLPERDDRRYSTLAFAIVYLAKSKKTRYSNELFLQMKYQLLDGTLHMEIPDYAIDLHLPEGRKAGRGHLHYLLEAASLTNEDCTFSGEARNWLIERARRHEGEKK